MKKIIREIIKKETNIVEDNILGVYLYGEKVYENKSDDNVYNYIVIVEDDINKKEINSFKQSDREYNIKIYGAQYFQYLIEEYDIDALEVYFLHESEMQYNGFEFKLDKNKFYNSIKKISSELLEKAKTYMAEGNKEEAIKYFASSIRTLEFGQQILEKGKITNYLIPKSKWNKLEEKYRELYNSNLLTLKTLIK